MDCNCTRFGDAFISPLPAKISKIPGLFAFFSFRGEQKAHLLVRREKSPKGGRPLALPRKSFFGSFCSCSFWLESMQLLVALETLSDRLVTWRQDGGEDGGDVLGFDRLTSRFCARIKRILLCYNSLCKTAGNKSHV